MFLGYYQRWVDWLLRRKWLLHIAPMGICHLESYSQLVRTRNSKTWSRWMLFSYICFKTSLGKGENTHCWFRSWSESTIFSLKFCKAYFFTASVCRLLGLPNQVNQILKNQLLFVLPVRQLCTHRMQNGFVRIEIYHWN